MPPITSRFKIDLFQMKHTKDPAGLLQAMKDANAAEFGRKLIEVFPYQKVKAFEGELPEMSLNREHEFVDEWECEVVVFEKKKWDRFVKECNTGLFKDALNNLLAL